MGEISRTLSRQVAEIAALKRVRADLEHENRALHHQVTCLRSEIDSLRAKLGMAPLQPEHLATHQNHEEEEGEGTHPLWPRLLT